MQAFVALFAHLDHTTATRAKVEALAAYFAATAARSPADAAWALHCLLGKQRRRLITGRRLRQICLEGTGLPDWLFDDCHAQVGDSAETIALLWHQTAPEVAPPRTTRAAAPPASDPTALLPPMALPLAHWMEQLLPGLAGLEGEQQAAAVQALWQQLQPQELLVANKLLTGGFRVGVAQGLVIRALAQLSELEEPLLAHRLMGGFQPGAAAWTQLLAPAEAGGACSSRPYPFFLASPLEASTHSPLPGSPADWLVEWKWDGIRGQLIRRAGESFLWSRGDELINPVFPELIALADSLPDGTVLDGEVIVWPQEADRPAPFAQLQRRLGRKAPGRSILAECPAAFVAYDLLEQGGRDCRSEPLSLRRAALEALHRQVTAATPTPAAGLLRLSSLLPFDHWDGLEPLRHQAGAAGAEGLMLKAIASPYLAGRRRGHWWKHKKEPLRLDAVMLYAQAGSGRRANLYTDYTFGLWERDPADSSGDAGQLVTFAKAYSGLDDAEISELDRWIRSHTLQRFGPVRAVAPDQVFELAFEGLQPSRRHRSGIAVRFPRIARWRRDKPAAEADSLASARRLLEKQSDLGQSDQAQSDSC
ncbi:ATP-dependent DNA ligase [Synechococcus sp. CCY9201]|uniref:ATP-dependent DNA ligase n=1 Tax=unclassified Synechococcus TaxID=2626047 RepID=UPI002B1FC7DA|nr:MULTISPECIES: ATP-dependent DNA ligase [unclassified Synechococcus]MEA5422049.1 ATP-dependent DNA ligase [Synechococcus sp. CCY9202]MEA5473226.1 ATP-dependent DNA ligase [Synechococcus sp. CCY9201]